MNFFHHKDLGNHLQLCPKVVKHPVFTYDLEQQQCQDFLEIPQNFQNLKLRSSVDEDTRFPGYDTMSMLSSYHRFSKCCYHHGLNF